MTAAAFNLTFVRLGNLARSGILPEEMITRRLPPRAFTLIELLVVIAIIAISPRCCCPRWAAPSSKAKVINCTSNYRQWGIVNNLYANDSPRGNLPSFTMTGTGRNARDVAPEMIPGLSPYGLTVPLWFCPVRPDEFNG